MRKLFILTILVVLCLSLSTVYGQDDGIHGYFDITYQSKYIWRGFDVYDDHSAIQPMLSLDLGRGWGVSAKGHRANSDGFENAERWDYTLFYNTQFFRDERYMMNCRFDYVYYNYPDMSSHTEASIDLQELNGIFSFPKITGVKGLVPTYILVRLWPSNSSSPVGSGGAGDAASGWAHIFCLDYPLEMECPFTSGTRVFNLHFETVYNDGVHPVAGQQADQDWSNAVFGVTTDFQVAENCTLTPGMYYQSSWDDTVNDEDEYWATLGMRYKF